MGRRNSAKTQTANPPAASVAKCPSCNLEARTGVFKCFTCASWFHIGCQNISNSEFAVIENMGDKVELFCDGCQEKKDTTTITVATTTASFETILTTVNNQLQAQQKTIDLLVQTVNKLPQSNSTQAAPTKNFRDLVKQNENAIKTTPHQTQPSNQNTVVIKGLIKRASLLLLRNLNNSFPSTFPVCASSGYPSLQME